MVHKVYVDSRAAKEGNASDFVWAPDRPLSIGRSRAYIDAVHMPVTWGTVTPYNRYVYVAEELLLLTVLATANKMYLRETSGGVVTDRIVTIPAAVYDGPTLATALATAMTAGTSVYTATYSTLAGTLGQISIAATGITSWTILSRATLLHDGVFNGSTLAKSALGDASDVLGSVQADVTGSTTGVVSLGHGLGYRRVELSVGAYTFDTMAAELTTALNTGTSLGTYPTTKNTTTGRLTVTNTSSPLKFHFYPSAYLDANPYSFQGFTGPFSASDNVTGFTGSSILSGNAITAASHVNMMAHHTIFINSTLGTHNDSLGPVGQSTIARKVVIDQPAGGFIHDFHSLGFDYIQLEKQSITSMRFRVTDWRGNPVEMSEWSLSIVFVPEDQF